MVPKFYLVTLSHMHFSQNKRSSSISSLLAFGSLILEPVSRTPASCQPKGIQMRHHRKERRVADRNGVRNVELSSQYERIIARSVKGIKGISIGTVKMIPDVQY